MLIPKRIYLDTYLERVYTLSKVHSIHLHRKLSTEANGRLLRKSSLSACHGIASCIKLMHPALEGFRGSA